MSDWRVFAAAVLGMAAATISPASASDPINVVATTGMIADTVEVVGGDKVVVRALMGPGVDPHAYRQTRSDIAAAAGADLVFRHGLYLEAQMEDFFQGLQKRVPVVEVGEVIPVADRIAHDVYDGKHDPHIWMAPKMWILVAEAVRDALTEQSPENAELFAANTAAYVAELEALDDYARTVLSTVPPDQRVLLTAHDAFGYFGEEFDFEVMGIQGISTESEAGLQRIGALVDELVDRELPAVFVETSVSDRNVRALVEGAGAAGHEVAIGGELFSDAMGEPGTYEGTYLGMIDHNVSTIADALGGDVPERGRLGKLGAGERS